MKLSQSLAKAMVSLVLAAQAGTVGIALYFAWNDAQSRAQDAMSVASAVAESFLIDRREQLAASVAVLTQDFGLRKALATGNLPTAESALANHAGRVDADHAMLLDRSGNVTTSTDRPLPISERLWSSIQGGSDQLVVLDDGAGRLYQLVVEPIRAPQLVGWATIGFEVDRALAERVKSLTGSEVAFRGGDGRVYASSNGYQSDSDALTFAKALDTVGAPLTLKLSRDRWEALSAFFKLRNFTLWITAASVLLAALLGWLLARRLTQSLSRLAEAAGRMQGGEYTNEPIDTPHREVQELGTALLTMQDEIADREARMRHQATHDALTNLPNQILALQRLQEEISTKPQLAAIVVVVNGLQDLHSSLGLSSGEAAVQALAKALAECEAHLLARLSDTRFLLVVSPGSAEAVCEALLARCQLLRIHDDIEVRLDLSFGVCTTGAADAANATTLVRRAWSASLEAADGQELIAEYQEATANRQERRLTIMRDLRSAVLDDQLHLLYQPKLDLSSGRFTAAEALLRWEHPVLGMVPVDEFIEVAEQTQDIHRLSRWVLRTALAQLSEWRQLDADFGVAVNISPHDLLEPEFESLVLGSLDEFGVPRSALELEVTERAFVRDVDRCVSLLARFREAGIHISIDDYGTGFSSLEQLSQLPADLLKIDKGFVMRLQDEPASRAIVGSTIDLGHELGLNIVAEGVEDQASLIDLARWGCDYAQGYHLSRPIPPAELAQFVGQPFGLASDLAALRRQSEARDASA